MTLFEHFRNQEKVTSIQMDLTRCNDHYDTQNANESQSFCSCIVQQSKLIEINYIGIWSMINDQ